MTSFIWTMVSIQGLSLLMMFKHLSSDRYPRIQINSLAVDRWTTAIQFGLFAWGISVLLQ